MLIKKNSWEKSYYNMIQILHSAPMQTLSYKLRETFNFWNEMRPMPHWYLVFCWHLSCFHLYETWWHSICHNSKCCSVSAILLLQGCHPENLGMQMTSSTGWHKMQMRQDWCTSSSVPAVIAVLCHLEIRGDGLPQPLAHQRVVWLWSLPPEDHWPGGNKISQEWSNKVLRIKL